MILSESGGAVSGTAKGIQYQRSRPPVKLLTKFGEGLMAVRCNGRTVAGLQVAANHTGESGVQVALVAAHRAGARLTGNRCIPVSMLSVPELSVVLLGARSGERFRSARMPESPLARSRSCSTCISRSPRSLAPRAVSSASLVAGTYSLAEYLDSQ